MNESLYRFRGRTTYIPQSVRAPQAQVNGGKLVETKRILVTGGAGFIGRHLVRELRSRGHEVLSVDLYNSDLDDFRRCDVREFRQLEEACQKRTLDYAYHLAAEYGRWNGEDFYENLWRTNVVGTKNLIRLQERLGFRLVLFSSAEVYGDYNGLMREDVMDLTEIKQLNDYAISKWVCELMSLNSADQFSTQTVRVRPVNCYGPGEHFTPYRGFIPKFIYSALHNKPYTVYAGHKRIIDYVEDTCRTVANIVENFTPGEVYNVGGRPEWESDIKDYSDMVLRFVGRDDALVTYKDAEPFTTHVKRVDCSKAVRDLGHNPRVAPEEGIRRTVEWMRKVYQVVG